MSSKFAQSENESARLAMLQLLQQDPDYEMNDSLLQSGLEQFSFRLGYRELQTELSWLEKEEVITLIKLDNAMEVTLINLTRHGEDVALGRCIVSGIARPRTKI